MSSSPEVSGEKVAIYPAFDSSQLFEGERFDAESHRITIGDQNLTVDQYLKVQEFRREQGTDLKTRLIHPLPSRIPNNADVAHEKRVTIFTVLGAGLLAGAVAGLICIVII